MTLWVVVVICITTGSASAASLAEAAPIEFGAGVLTGIAGFCVVALLTGGSRMEFPVCAYFGMLPIGIYSVGEMAEGGSKNKTLSFCVTAVTSYTTPFVCMKLTDSTLGLFLLPALTGMIAYNLVRIII